jgi:hypothetical protein
VALIFFGGSIALMAGGQGSDALMGAGVGMMLIGLIIFIILAIAIGLIAIFGGIRFARTDSFGEAFNISAIMAHIGSIGWLDYIIALIIMWIVLVVAVMIFIIAMGIVSFILALIPLVGWLLALILIAVVAVLIGPFVGVFEARYLTLIYDSAEA